MKKHTVYLFALLCASLAGASTAHAQIIGQIEAKVPFAFTAGTGQYPPGSYTFHINDGLHLTIMEMRSTDGKTTALFGIREARSSHNTPSAELVFNHVGDHYFLSKIFNGGGQSGDAVIEAGKKTEAEEALIIPAQQSGS